MIAATDQQQAAFRRLMADEQLVQAGSWMAGHLQFHPGRPVSVPTDVRGAPDPSTDVPFPDWPFADAAGGRAALERFVEAGLLEPAEASSFRPTEWGGVMIPILPLFHVRNTERLESRFPRLREAVRGRKILDAGCGLAPYAVWLHELGAAEVVGVDCFQKHLDLAARVVAAMHADTVRLMFGFLEQMPLPDASVDFVYCRGVVSLAHKQRTMAEFSRVLAPGGHCLLMLHAPAFYWRMVKLLGPSKLRLRRSWAGMRGLLAGAAFELFGWNVKWRRDPVVMLAYERRKPFTRLAESCGFQLVSWEEGIPKPFVWLTKRA